MFASAANVVAAACPNSFDYSVFGPREHIENLHPHNRRGTGGLRDGVVAFAQNVPGRDKPWQEWTVAAGSGAIWEAERLLRQDNRSDIYVSQAAFHKRRSISQLTAIAACYTDLDYHNCARWKGRNPADVASAVVGHLEDAMVPAPSYILSTGRGLVCVWLTELLPRVALPRWNAVQKRLWEVLETFGGDRRALDAARVFRLCGSENSRAEWDRRTVSMVWCQGSPETPARHVFGTLADEVLPFTHAELISLRAERAKRKAEGNNKTAPAVRHTAESYWESVLTDLQRLRAHRRPEGALSEGQRDAWLFIAGVAVSWISPPEVLRREIFALADEAAGWRDSETKSRMSAVIKRAQQAAAGQKITFGNREVDCRYRMKASTIVEWLG
ncbi:Plasmid replication-like protein, partial CDS, partial [Neorhizobium galegae bv. orientalis]